MFPPFFLSLCLFAYPVSQGPQGRRGTPQDKALGTREAERAGRRTERRFSFFWGGQGGAPALSLSLSLCLPTLAIRDRRGEEEHFRARPNEPGRAERARKRSEEKLGRRGTSTKPSALSLSHLPPPATFLLPFFLPYSYMPLASVGGRRSRPSEPPSRARKRARIVGGSERSVPLGGSGCGRPAGLAQPSPAPRTERRHCCP